MAERNLTPDQIAFAHREYLNKGLCPNSGMPCPQVLDLKITLNASGDSLRMAGPLELPGGQAVVAEFTETSYAVTDSFNKALRDSTACLGNCAISQE